MATISLTHAHVTAIANDPSKDVSANVWNAGHTVPQTGTGANVVSDVSPTITQPSCNNGFFVTQSGGGSSWYVFVDVDGNLKVESPGAVITQIGPSLRPVLTTNTTINVPSTFATLELALQFAAAADFGGHTLTIQLANGTYTPLSNSFVIPATVGQATAGNFIIQGNLGSPTSVVLTSSVSFSGIVEASTGTRCQFQGVQFVGIGGNTHGVHASRGALVQFQTCDWGAGMYYHRFSEYGGQIQSVGAYSISGSCQAHVGCGGGGTSYDPPGITITLTGTPAWTTAFVQANLSASVRFDSPTYSGAATGPRYLINYNAIVATNGSGATYLPGNSAGTADGTTGGYYL